MRSDTYHPAPDALAVEKRLDIRFSEVDSMHIVWHGAYALYFEDAREAFGARYGIEYLTMHRAGLQAPIVDLTFHYIKPVTYGMHPVIRIIYEPTAAAKLIFHYEIRDGREGELLVTGHSVQVFLDTEGHLLWNCPEFYENWKKKWNINI